MPKSRKNIFAIAGSRNATNERLIKFIANRYQETISIELFEGVDTLPHFIPGLSDENLPQSVISFRNRIETADAVLFSTPEYVFSLPGSLKNAIEWLVSTTVLSNKPAAFIVAAASGEKAFAELELILATLEARVAEDSKLLIQGAKGKIAQDGEPETPALLIEIERLISSLIDSVA